MDSQVYQNEVIINDEDTKEIDSYENGALYPVEMPKEVDIKEDYLTVFEWIRKLKRGDLIIDPEFQRKLVWTPEQKSRFIESILLNIPLPPIYVNQDKNGKFIIVDGLQRTTTLSEFRSDDSFKLNKLEVLRDLNNKKFYELGEPLQTIIEDKKLVVYVIRPTVPLAMVYDIFNRINTGGTQLNRQEIRNCLYFGQSTRLLKRLSEKEYFREAIDDGISAKRMKDREAILRYLAFRVLGYQSYQNDMDDFLGKALKKINNMLPEEIEELERDVERVMKHTLAFFGQRNFRIPTGHTRGRINIALLESVSFFFSHQSDEYLNENKEVILNNFDKLLSNNEFLDSVKNSTSSRKRVIRRFELAQEILGDVGC